jgi:ribosomal protein L11 methyltransferase
LASYPALEVRYVPGPHSSALHELLYAELDEFEPLAIHDLPAADGWRVFFRLASQRDAAQAALASALGTRLLGVSPVDVDDEDWARRSQAALTAIRAGRITVAPPWDIPERSLSFKSRLSRHEAGTLNPESQIPNPEFVIVIEPSMGFGTGHHATTRLCLELLQEIDVAGKRVVDVGTGSGVLAIAVARLGASRVIAIDNDPDALQNARDNIARNFALPRTSSSDAHSLTFPDIEVIESDLSSVSADCADVVLANLTGAVLQRHAAALRRLMDPSAVIIVSGFSPDEQEEVVAALGLPVAATRRDGEWAAAVLGPTAAGVTP